MVVPSKKTDYKPYWEKLFPQSEQSLLSWHEDVNIAEWNNPNELKVQYKNASVLTNKRVVFNIHGNTYRLIVNIEYRLKIVFIVWFRTHKEYENEHYSVSQPNPLEAIKFRLEQMNMSETELSEILGARSRKSEILSGKRKLSLAMIRKLKEKLNIPAEVLIQSY